MNIYESLITVKLLYEIKYKIHYCYFYDTLVSSSKAYLRAYLYHVPFRWVLANFSRYADQYLKDMP